jgi:hypothetical protein
MTTLSTLNARLPIQKFILQPHASSVHNVFYQAWRPGYLRNLRKNGRTDDALVLLKTRPNQTPQFRADAARERWSEVCAGRTNYWEPTEEELDSEVLAAIGAA